LTDALTLRFEEWHRYDIQIDEPVIRLLGITGAGTYTGECSYHNAADLRDKRQRFREYVLECMDKGLEPHEVDIA
jgi:hypothetical protein